MENLPPPAPEEMEVNENEEEELTFEVLSTENESLKRRIVSLEGAINANDAALDEMLRSIASRNFAEELEAKMELQQQLIQRLKERNERVLQR